MEEFRGLFKTTAFLSFSGVWGVIKVQDVFLNVHIFVNILNICVRYFSLKTWIRSLQLVKNVLDSLVYILKSSPMVLKLLAAFLRKWLN